MEEDGEGTRGSRQDGSAITLDAALAAAVCAVGASAGRGGGINVLVVGDAAAVSSAASGGRRRRINRRRRRVPRIPDPLLPPCLCVTTGGWTTDN